MTTQVVQEHNEIDELLTAILDALGKDELEIPLLPHVAARVLQLTNDPKTDAAQMAALIQQDQALASQVLRIANSPAYMPRSPIQSLQQAIAWLGLHLLGGTALSVSIQSGVFHVKGYEQEVKGLWRDAFATALYAKAIASRIDQNVENAFLCGLLHAIGKPFVVHTVNQYRGDAAERLPWSAMVQVMKESYIEVGTQLAMRWQLPDPVKEVIHLHQDHAYHLGTSPLKGTPITCLAIHFAALPHELTPQDEEQLRSLPVVPFLGIPPEEIKALIEMRDHVWASVDSMVV